MMRRRRGGGVLGVLIRGRLECLPAEHLPRMEVFSTQLLNYHLERREEVIKINLGRRSPEKSGGEVELMIVQLHGLQAVHQGSLRLCGSG